MSGPQEIELKLRLTNPGDYDLLINDPILSIQFKTEQVRVKQYITTYFDTSEQLLYQNGFSYRIRKTADGCTATVKDQGSQRGGLFVRGEWNVKVNSESATVEPFRELPVGELLAEIVGSQDLVPLFKTEFSRTAVDLRTETGSLIELAADRGTIIADNGVAPICEVELELKSGAAVDLLRVGATLADKYPLLVEEKSKYARGLELLGQTAGEGSSTLDIDRNGSIAAALGSGGIYYLQEIFAMQGKFLAQPGDPETIHQIRVKNRHLRSWLSFFKPVIKADRYLDITAVLKELSGRLGYIREIDVLQEGWGRLARTYPDLIAADSQLTRRLAAEREKEQASAYERMAVGMETPGLLRVWAWLMEGSWDEQGEAGQPLRPFITKRLRQRLQRLEKGMERTDFSDLQSLHALRIQAKKMRYILQSLDQVLKKKYRQKLPAFKEMQERLGIICDAQRNIAVVRDLNSSRKNNALQYESGIYIGFLLSQADCLAREAVKEGFPEVMV